MSDEYDMGYHQCEKLVFPLLRFVMIIIITLLNPGGHNTILNS